MYTYTCVCLYLYIYMYMFIYLSKFLYTHIYIYILYIYTYVCVYIQHILYPTFYNHHFAPPERISLGLPGSTTTWPWTTRKVYVVWQPFSAPRNGDFPGDFHGIFMGFPWKMAISWISTTKELAFFGISS